jgi:serine/threonine-protein kinase
MSPEQARGEEIDWRSDIFAIGVMLFELTTGKRLFKGATEFETLKLIIEREYPRPSHVAGGYPLGLEQIVMRALEKDRDRRYQSAREMQADLEAFVRDAKLPVSSIALAEFMKMLFEEKLQAQKEALMQGRQLAEIIAQEIVHSEKTGTGIDSGRFSSHNTSTGSGAIATGTVPPPAKSAKWPFVAIPLVAIAAAGAAFALKGKKEEPTVAAEPVEKTAVSKASLVVKSDPPGAHIWINGEVRAEVTPATIENLPIGKVDVKVGMEGYASKTEAVELQAGPAATRNFTLQKGVLTVNVGSVPDGATATLDGKKVSLPSFEATPGDPHTVVISAPGYLPKTLKVNGELGETKKLDGALDKIPAGGFALPKGGGAASPPKEPAAAAPAGNGKLMVSASGGWCNVSVDGKPQGATPTGAVELSAGSHSVTCTDANGKSVSQGAKVNPGETTRVKFSL